MPLEYKSADTEFKASSSADGEYEGYFSVTGNVDDGGDVIEAGAFDKTLKERKSKICVLFGHDMNKIAGPPPTVIEEDSKGLHVKGRLTVDSTWGRETWILMKDGALNEGSIGYQSIPSRTEWKSGIRHLKEVKLFEVSFVPLGMNPETAVSAVKAWDASGGKLGLLLEILNRFTAGIDTVNASSGMDLEAINDVLDVMGITQTSLWRLRDDYYCSEYPEYMGLPAAAEAKAAREVMFNALKALAAPDLKTGRVISESNLPLLMDVRSTLTTSAETLKALIDAAAPGEKAHSAPQVEALRARYQTLEQGFLSAGHSV